MPDALRRQRDVAEHRDVREEVELLEDHADLATDGVEVADVVSHLNAVDDDAALLVLFQAVDHADEGGFAGTGGSEDDHDFAAFDAHADIAHGAEVVEPLMDVFTDHDVIALFERTGQDFRLVRGDVDGRLKSVGFRHG